MRFTAISALLGLAACASAANITVIVAQGGALNYTPSSVTASEGDVISFQFVAGNHTVTQSSFSNPCTMLSTGIDSEFQPASSNASMVPEYSFTVSNASAPLWFYCRQGRHCQAGMVFAVNPTTDETFDAFRAKATGSSTNSTNSSPGGSYPTQTGSTPSPSASNNPSNSAAPGFGSFELTGAISLVAIFAGSLL